MAAPQRFWESQALTTAHPCRYIDPVSGIRFYPIPATAGGWLSVPGVTSLLGALDTPEDKQRLADWRERELAAGRDPNAGRDRGTRVHAALEQWIRSGQSGDLAAEDLAFFRGMERHLDRFEEFLWNERPLVEGWDICWNAPAGAPDRLARVFSRTWGYAGTPDLIARRRGLTILGDFKTSTKPYFRCSGSAVPAHHAGGYRKYTKTVRQLIAYTMAAEELIPELHIDALQILVALPEADQTQSFLIERNSVEFEREAEVVKQLAVKFWQQFGVQRQAQTAAAALPPTQTATASGLPSHAPPVPAVS